MSKNVGSISFGQGAEAIRQVEKALNEFEKLCNGGPTKIISPLLKKQAFEKATKRLLLGGLSTCEVKDFFGKERISIEPLSFNSDFEAFAKKHSNLLLDIPIPNAGINTYVLSEILTFPKIEEAIKSKGGFIYHRSPTDFFGNLYLLIIDIELGQKLGFHLEEGNYYFMALESSEPGKFLEFTIEFHNPGYTICLTNTKRDSPIQYAKDTVYLYPHIRISI